MKMKGLLLALVAWFGFAASTPRHYKICPATATSSHPQKTYCTCQRGKLLRVVVKGGKPNYFCEARATSHGRCSTNKAKPTTKECTCYSSRYDKVSTTVSHGNEHTIGYYCKSNVKACAANTFCSFSITGMTSTTYNARVRKCNTTTKESTKYCSCKSKKGYYLRYTYHKKPTKLANGTTHYTYTHGYVCIPRFVHHTATCPKSATSKAHASRRYCRCPSGTRSQNKRVKVGGKKGHTYQNQYWCQKTTTCASAHATQAKPSKNYCSCNSKNGEYLKYVRGKCSSKKTAYYPSKCNTGKYKGYRIGFCYNNSYGGYPRPVVYGKGSPHILRSTNSRTPRLAGVSKPRRRLANVKKQTAAQKAAARAAKRNKGKKTSGCTYRRKAYKVNQTRISGSYVYKCMSNHRFVRQKTVCAYRNKTYTANKTRTAGSRHYICKSGRWVYQRNRSCKQGTKTYKNNQTRKAGTVTYKCSNGVWRKQRSTTCKYGSKTYKNGQTRVQSKTSTNKRTHKKTTKKTTLQCRRGRWVTKRARHNRAQEHQCCKRINCMKRDVGYYCYKRASCAGASATKPHSTFCHCATGTHLTYVHVSTKVHGYYCKKLSACSTNKAKPSPTNCTCRAGYTKKYVRGKRTRTAIKSGHGTRYRYKTVGGGHYCATRSDYCPTYNHSKLGTGASKYSCNCRKGYNPHYYRYNNKFYKACMATKTKNSTCTHRSRQSCLFATNCSYRVQNGRGICSTCTGTKCVQRKTPPPPRRRPAIDTMPQDGGAGGFRPRL